MVQDVRQNRGFLLRSMASFHVRITHAHEDNCGMSGIVRLQEGDTQELDEVKNDWSACKERCCTEQLAEGRLRQGHCGFPQWRKGAREEKIPCQLSVGNQHTQTS